MRIRRGDTLIELVIATALFATLLISVLPITNFIRVSGEESSYYLNSIVQAINVNQGVQDEWESAQRMQSGNVNPQNITSIAFKKSYSLLPTYDNWIQYSISGKDLKRRDTSLTSTFQSVMTPIDSNNNYLKWTFYTIDGQTLASNLGSGISVVTGLNDVPTTYWILEVIYAIKGYPFVISSIREITPLYDNPTASIVSFTGNYMFNQPMDTKKDPYYNGFTGVFLDDVTASASAPMGSWMSNYMGIPYKNHSTILNAWYDYNGLNAILYDDINDERLANRKVYCFLPNNTFVSGTTDSNGKVTFYNVFSSSYTLKFNGDDTHVPCTYKKP